MTEYKLKDLLYLYWNHRVWTHTIIEPCLEINNGSIMAA